ncbi:hypothetical protein HAX54_051531 [Datura stramonium]|uniref:Uncharacterized protein n=1 Tax=Datura stramonium TaxID=4076 RepID=A0ABS8RRI7_DATST|nr:hypothetical protein [Datura stramonium]
MELSYDSQDLIGVNVEFQLPIISQQILGGKVELPKDEDVNITNLKKAYKMDNSDKRESHAVDVSNFEDGKAITFESYGGEGGDDVSDGD